MLCNRLMLCFKQPFLVVLKSDALTAITTGTVHDRLHSALMYIVSASIKTHLIAAVYRAGFKVIHYIG